MTKLKKFTLKLWISDIIILEVNGTTKMKHHMGCFIEEMLEYTYFSLGQSQFFCIIPVTKNILEEYSNKDVKLFEVKK